MVVLYWEKKLTPKLKIQSTMREIVQIIKINILFIKFEARIRLIEKKLTPKLKIGSTMREIVQKIKINILFIKFEARIRLIGRLNF
jgi:hypothetical protein